MAKETEIKLRVSPETLAALRDSSLIESRRCQPWQQRNLLNCYFDTAEFSLAGAQVALRIRQDGEQLIQTLKTRGASVAGLSERNEWDWYLTENNLDVEKLTDDCWPETLKELDKQTLSGIFHTDFTRELVELCWQYEGEEARVELALDFGVVRTSVQTEEICEMELELRQGQPEALLELAQELANEFALMPCDISKAERGYRLLRPGSFELQVPMAELTADSTMDVTTYHLAMQLLSNSQRLAEQYRHSAQWKLLEQWIYSLIQLRALLTSLGQIVPRKSSNELRQMLDELLTSWMPVYQAAEQEGTRQHAVEQFAQELTQVRWGQFSLRLALWLHQQAWKKQRNERAKRQAQAPLARWLVRFLREELSSIPLSDYVQQPQLLTEQLPRVERVVFWLEHARHVLNIAQLDAMLGSARKLQQAILQQDEQALRQQAASLWQNVACRQIMNS
ncbi:inorganic triphosphatase [Thiopseudomonas acetoxidans]|uniref:CYTH domain-containing protein n=1 Tax=Thiopseudomonas acetoxidans TaxID=3041622 RepID=A0ABT7SR72_9GAMM|nr:CYTH domain-containing protein [Thiopseudomonas sp. CY1220]MDM7858698.1 CYTH domain-containing protein [Thiopseudomonas sp. CY1220]